jgi:hypothetical protein
MKSPVVGFIRKPEGKVSGQTPVLKNEQHTPTIVTSDNELNL